jgi:hypothetical protein
MDQDKDLDLSGSGFISEGSEAVKKASPPKTKTKAVVDKENKIKAVDMALATTALETTLKSQGAIARKEAEKEYIIEKKKHMLNRCKEDEVMTFTGDKLYAQYFGKVYTFLYNTVPVTVRFDGTKQKFPKFVYEFLIKKINAVSESNTNKEVEYEL